MDAQAAGTRRCGDISPGMQCVPKRVAGDSSGQGETHPRTLSLTLDQLINIFYSDLHNPINSSYQPTFLHPPSQCSLSTPLLKPITIHPLKPPPQPTLSPHPINTQARQDRSVEEALEQQKAILEAEEYRLKAEDHAAVAKYQVGGPPHRTGLYVHPVCCSPHKLIIALLWSSSSSIAQVQQK